MEDATPPVPVLLKLDALDEGPNHLEFELAADQFGLQDPFLTLTSAVRVELDVRRSLEAFDVRGRVQAAVAGECCRCLARAQVPLLAEFAVALHRWAAPDLEAEAGDDDGDMEIVPPGTKVVDLGERVRDAVIIDLPVRLYCSEDCKGLCPRCGHDLNQGPCGCAEEEPDQRWQALEGLKFT